MKKINIFPLLVVYHQQVNLERCKRYIDKNGRILVEGQHLKEGSDIKTPHQGMLIIANGDTLVDRLRKGEIIFDEPEPFTTLSDKNDFFTYLDKQIDCDGAYVFDSVNSRITRVDELNNSPRSLPRELNIYDMIPNDFVSSDGSIYNSLGTKTRLAIKIPHAYPNTEAFQIKRSAYTHLGMGKVTHFDRDGLNEEFFFRTFWEDQQLTLRLIKGVYRTYSRENDKLIRVSQRIIDLKDLTRFDEIYSKSVKQAA
jgi:hypothetical protein